MSQIAIEVPIDLDKLVNRLTPEQQYFLSRKLWAIRIERFSQKMRDSVKKNRITQNEIKKMCEEARKKVYEKYSS